MIKKEIIDYIKKNKTNWIRLRYYLHQNPEKSMHEFNTTRKIKDELVKFGFSVYQLEKSGVIGILKNGNSNKTIALRVSIDAINIKENNEELNYQSLNDYSHCSGNDGHIIFLLAACQYFSEFKTFYGTIVVIFQPGKEKLCGANYVINDDYFQGLKIDEIHTLVSITNNEIKHSKYGDFCLFDKEETILPTNDMVKFNIFPKNIKENNFSNPILTCSAIILNLQTIISNDLSVSEKAKINIGNISGGDDANPIASLASFRLNLLTFDLNVRDKIINRIEQIVFSLCEMYNCSFDLELIGSSANIENNINLVEDIKSMISTTFGEDKIKILDKISITEDFGEYLKTIPGTIVFINNGNDEKIYSSKYNFSDEILPYGISYFITIIENRLCK